MNEKIEQACNLINSAAACLPLVELTDKGPLADALSEIEKVKAMEDLPDALKTMAKRVIRLSELIILDDTPFESGMKQLSVGLSRMEKALRDSSNGETEKKVKVKSKKKKTQRESEPEVKSESDAQQVASDMVELVVKFAQQLDNALEDFETYVLESEKGVDQALVEIKRMLHTWKGEFGVLDMGEYVDLVHTLEGRIEEHIVSTDQLLHFKDLLGKMVEKLQQGEIMSIPEASKKVLLQKIESAQSVRQPEKVQGEVAQQPERSPSKVEEAVKIEVEQPEPEDATLNADPGLLADFVTEANDHIQRVETLLLELEIDPSNMENINTIFRACHTIKGVASFLSLKNLTKVAHSTENLMDQIRKGKIELTPSRIDILFEAMDCLQEMVSIVAGVLEGNPYTIPESCGIVLTHLAHSEKDVSIQEIPTSDAGSKRVGELLIERGEASPIQVEKALQLQKEGDLRPIGEILIEKNKVTPRTVGKALAAQTMAKSMKNAVEDTIRVPIKRLDQLIDAIGEGVIAQSMVYANSSVAGLKDLALEKKIAQSMLIMRQIQEMSMSLRMVALRSTFQKMARLVRDLAKKVSKEVDLILDGEDTELDKSVVENIGDPLIHMLRNSLDHGIESIEERRAAGKPDKARITIRAYHKAGNVCIEIGDDGRGLDRDKILKKAIERGICREEDNPTDQEIYHYVFMPGFSTAAVVTDISGRGVGMDVVQRNISALRGAIDIQSEKAVGTLFTIRLPLTLAIINGMIVKLNKERYIVPTLSILESILPKKEQIESIVGKGEIIKMRGELVRLIRLEKLFFGTGNGKVDKDAAGVALIVEDAVGRKVALFVDEIIDQQQVVIKNLGEGMGEIPGVAGGAIMSDGTISLILDIAGIVKIAAE